MTTIDDPLDRTPGDRSAAEPEAEITLAFENNRYASLVFGHYDQNLAKIERRLNVASFANGNHVTLKGKSEACEHARRVLEALYERVALGQTVALGDVDGAIEETARQRSLFPDAGAGARRLRADHRRANAGRCAPATPRRTSICAR